MAQLNYGDLEARGQLADVDSDRHQINVQGEGYGVFSNEHQRRPHSPNPPSSDDPLQVHHERQNPFSIADKSDPLTVPPGVGNFPVTSGYGNLDLKPEESRTAAPPLGGLPGPVGTKDAPKEEGTFDLRGAPKEEAESMAKELEDPFARNLPATSGYESLDAKLDEPRKAFPGGGLDESRPLNQRDASKEESMVKEFQQRGTPQEEFQQRDVPQEESTAKEPSGGLDESSSFNQRDAPKEEPIAKELEQRDTSKEESVMKDFGSDESFPARQRGPSKELEDQSAERGGLIDVHGLNDDFVDLSGGNINKLVVGNQPPDVAASHRETGKYTFEVKSAGDDPKQEQTSQIDSPVDDDLKLEGTPQFDEHFNQHGSMPCPPRDDSQYGCQSFEGEDGRKKISVESFNVYSGEPEKVVYDAADVMDGQPERGPNMGVDRGVGDLKVGDVKVQESEPRVDENENVADSVDHGVRDLPEGFGEVKVQESEPRVDENENAPAPREGDPKPLAPEDADIAQEPQRKRDMHNLGEDEEQSQKEGGMDSAVSDILTKGEMPSQADERPDGDVSMPSQKGADRDVGDMCEVEMQPQAEEDAAIAQELDRKLDARELRDDQVSQSGKGHFESKEQADIPMEQQADVPQDHEDKATIVDVKSDDQAGIQVRNFDQPGLDDGVGMQEGVTPSKDTPEMHNAQMVQVRNLDQPGLDEGVGTGEGLPPSKDVSETPKQETVDEDLGSQDELLPSGMAQVWTLNQSGLDEGVGIRKELPPPKDIPENPKQESGDGGVGPQDELPPSKDIPETLKQERRDEGVGPQDELLPSKDMSNIFKQERRDEPKSAEAGEQGDEGLGPRDELLSVGIRKELPPPKEIPETPKQEIGDEGVGLDELLPSKDVPEILKQERGDEGKIAEPREDARDIESPLEFKELKDIAEPLKQTMGDEGMGTLEQERADEGVGPQEELLPSRDVPGILKQERGDERKGAEPGEEARDIESPLEFKKLAPSDDVLEPPKNKMGDGVGTLEQERADEGLGAQDELFPPKDMPEILKQEERRDEPESAEAGQVGDEGLSPRDELLSVGIPQELPPPKEIPETIKQERGVEGVGPDELLPSKDVPEISKQESEDEHKSAEPGEEARDIESPLELKELPPSKDIAEPFKQEMGDEGVGTLEQERVVEDVGPQEELLPSKDLPELLKQERGDERKSAEPGEEARGIESPLEFKELPPSKDIPEPPKQKMGDEGVGILEQEKGDEGVGPQDELLPSKEVPEILKQARDIESSPELKELPPSNNIPEPPKQKMGNEGVGTLEQERADEGVGPQDELLSLKELPAILKQERGDELKNAEPGEEGKDIESPLELKELPPSKDIPETPTQKMGDEGVGIPKQDRADGVGPRDELLLLKSMSEILKQESGDERKSAERGEGRDIDGRLEGRGIENPLELEDKATIGDVKSDYQTGMRQVRNVDQPVANEGVDIKDELPLSRDMPGIFKQDMRDESSGAGQGEESNDMDLPPKQREETTFGDMKSAYPGGIGELRDIDQRGADADVVGSLEKPVVDADFGAQEEEFPVQNPEQSTADPGMVPLANMDAAPLPIMDVGTQEESPADVVVGPPADEDKGRQDESLLRSPVQPPADVGVGPLAGKDVTRQDEAFLQSPDQPIADVDLDLQEEESPVRNPDQPIADAGMVPVPTIGVATREKLPADVGVGSLADEAVGRQDESLLRSPGQPIADAIDESKGSEQAEKREETRVIDEEQKGMAKGGEQFILNAPVVDYNARNLPVEQDAELKLDTQNRELHPNAGTANFDSPYTEFERTGDYVKEGYGAEGFLPTNNEDVERKLRAPVDQEKVSRQLDERPLDKTLQLDEQGKFDERVQLPPSMQASELYKRPATLPHPQPEDLAGIVNNGGGGKDDDRGRKDNNVVEHDEGHHHKKGVFERIKEKLTPPFGDHHSH